MKKSWYRVEWNRRTGRWLEVLILMHRLVGKRRWRLKRCLRGCGGLEVGVGGWWRGNVL